MRLAAWASTLAVLTVSGSAQDAELAQQIEALRFPRVAFISAGVNKAVGVALAGWYEPTDEERRAELAEIQARVDADEATPSDWARRHHLNHYLSTDLTVPSCEQAIERIESRLEETPKDPALLTDLASLYVCAGNPTWAERLCNRALAADPNHFDAYAPLIKSLELQGLPYLAWIEQATWNYPDLHNNEAIIEAGEIPQPGGENHDHYAELLGRVSPELREGYDNLANPTDGERIIESAALGRAKQVITEARSRAEAKINADPTPELLRQYTSLSGSLLGMPLMLAAIEPGFKIDQPPGTNSTQTLMDAVVYPGTLELAAKVCEAHPDHPGANGVLGRLLALGVWRDAAAPGNDDAPWAGLPADAEAAEKAIAHLRKAMTLPVHRREGTLSALATMLFFAGSADECIDLVDEAVRRGEWEDSAVGPALMCGLGLSLADMANDRTRDLDADVREHPRAAEMLAEWLQVAEPEDAVAYALFAKMNAALGDLEAALTALDRAIELDAEHAGYHCAKGIILLKLDRPDEAIDSLNAALALGMSDNAKLDASCKNALQLATKAAAN